MKEKNHNMEMSKGIKMFTFHYPLTHSLTISYRIRIIDFKITKDFFNASRSAAFSK